MSLVKRRRRATPQVTDSNFSAPVAYDQGKHARALTTSATTNAAALSDSNLTASSLQGDLSLFLSDLIQSIPLKLESIKSDNMSTVITFKALNMELTNLYVPPTNLQRYYELDKFNTNFKQAFGKNFPLLVSSQILPGVNITILNNLPYTTQTFLSDMELASFRLLTCMLLGIMFNISLDACACFPKNLNELKAVNAGLGLNCVNLECKNMLKANPLMYDDLIHTDCNDLMLNAAFVSLNLFAGKDINLDINLNQLANNPYSQTMDVATVLATLKSVQDQVSSLNASTSFLSDKILQLERVSGDIVPIGTIFKYVGARANVPSTYLVCENQRIKRSDYPKLDAVITKVYDAKTNTDTYTDWGVDGDYIVLPRADNVKMGDATGVQFFVIKYTNGAASSPTTITTK